MYDGLQICGLPLPAVVCSSLHDWVHGQNELQGEDHKHVGEQVSCPCSVMSLIKLLLNAACYNAVPFDLQVALVEPLMCKLLFWHFDHITSQFLGEEVGVTEVLSESAIWLLRYKGCILSFGRLCSNRSHAHQLMNDGMVGEGVFLLF